MVCFDIFQLDLLEDLEEYASAFHLWSNSETKLATPLSATAFALDKNVEALKSVVSFSHFGYSIFILRGYSYVN